MLNKMLKLYYAVVVCRIVDVIKHIMKHKHCFCRNFVFASDEVHFYLNEFVNYQHFRY